MTRTRTSEPVVVAIGEVHFWWTTSSNGGGILGKSPHDNERVELGLRRGNREVLACCAFAVSSSVDVHAWFTTPLGAKNEFDNSDDTEGNLIASS